MYNQMKLQTHSAQQQLTRVCVCVSAHLFLTNYDLFLESPLAQVCPDVDGVFWCRADQVSSASPLIREQVQDTRSGSLGGSGGRGHVYRRMTRAERQHMPSNRGTRGGEFGWSRKNRYSPKTPEKNTPNTQREKKHNESFE